jgi:hypothetical protein
LTGRLARLRADWKAVADAGKEPANSAQAVKDKLGIMPVTLAYPYAAWNVAVVKPARK